MIRKFKFQDIDAVMDIWLSSNIDAHSFVPEEYWRSKFENVKQMIPQAELYVSENNDVINGFIGVADDYIEGIFVDSRYRTLGIGTELLNAVKAYRKRLSLSVYEKNERAVRFYEKSGFYKNERNVDKSTGEIEYTMVWERNDEQR